MQLSRPGRDISPGFRVSDRYLRSGVVDRPPPRNYKARLRRPETARVIKAGIYDTVVSERRIVRAERVHSWATAAQLAASMKPPPIPMPSVTMAAT